MTLAEVRKLALGLPSDERTDLAVELWESLGQEVPIPDWHREVLRERLAELEGLSPEERSTPWEEVRRRIWPKG